MLLLSISVVLLSAGRLTAGGNDAPTAPAFSVIPARKLGRTEFKAGDAVDLSSTLLTHARAYRMEWKRNFTLRQP